MLNLDFASQIFLEILNLKIVKKILKKNFFEKRFFFQNFFFLSKTWLKVKNTPTVVFKLSQNSSKKNTSKY